MEGLGPAEDVHVPGQGQVMDRFEHHTASLPRGCRVAGHQRNGRTRRHDCGRDEEFIDPVRDVERLPRVNGNSLQRRHEGKSVLD